MPSWRLSTTFPQKLTAASATKETTMTIASGIVKRVGTADDWAMFCTAMQALGTQEDIRNLWRITPFWADNGDTLELVAQSDRDSLNDGEKE